LSTLSQGAAFVRRNSHLTADVMHMQDDFFMELRLILMGKEEVTELYPVPDSHLPVLKFKFNRIFIDLVYARLSLCAIPDISVLCFLSIIIRNMFFLDTSCRGVSSGFCKLVFCIILWESIFFVLMHN
jgi:hypothetical protein